MYLKPRCLRFGISKNVCVLRKIFNLPSAPIKPNAWQSSTNAPFDMWQRTIRIAFCHFMQLFLFFFSFFFIVSLFRGISFIFKLLQQSKRKFDEPGLHLAIIRQVFPFALNRPFALIGFSLVFLWVYRFYFPFLAFLAIFF